MEGELLTVPERVILAPAPGKFRPAESTDDQLIEEQVIGFVDGVGHSTPVRSPFSGLFMGLMAYAGERVREGQPVAWLRSPIEGPSRDGIAAAIAGWGMAVPERRVTNAELSMRVDTSDAWIVDRTGIRERRVAGPGETTASLAIEAGAAAIKRADLSPSDIGCCIVATCTPEQPMPPTSSFVQDALGLQCGAFDLDAACSGFVYGLVIGASLVATTGAPVLVIGSETLSRITDPDDRSTCVLFGDGAGAVVLVPSAEPRLVAWDLGSDGSAASLLYVSAGGSRRPTSAETVAEGGHWLQMEGSEVFRRAVRAIVDSATTTLATAGLTAADVDVFVPHQANSRIIDAAVSRLGLPADKAVVNIDRYGNTSAASIPIALCEAAEDGRVLPGDLLLLSGFGAGMSWASALIRWGRD